MSDQELLQLLDTLFQELQSPERMKLWEWEERCEIVNGVYDLLEFFQLKIKKETGHWPQLSIVTNQELAYWNNLKNKA